ncbi:leukocyte antigen CD37 isoform X6 [Anguilla rostrata]|uniref:leukocyte antigen CD37 isoform X6 n=1 Tax=Anguilla rostrata TaxID=7938 RepID=UPI0030D3D1C9
MVSQGCLSLIKYFLFLFNLFFFTLGLLLLSLGLWIVFDEVSFFMPAPSSLSLSVLSYFLAIGGTVTMAVGFFGCVGALKEVRCMLGMYFFLLTVLLAAQIVGGVIFFTQKTAFENKVKEHVLQIITSIRKNNSSLNHFEKTLEYIQREVNCCGWNGPMDWGDDMVPCSCYQLPNSTVFEHINQGMNNGSQKLCPCHSTVPQNNTCNIYNQGCREGIKEWLEENVVIILGVLFAVVLVEFIQCIGLTMFYCLSHCHHCCHQPLKTNDRLFQPSRDFYMEYWQALWYGPFDVSV